MGTPYRTATLHPPSRLSWWQRVLVRVVGRHSARRWRWFRRWIGGHWELVDYLHFGWLFWCHTDGRCSRISGPIHWPSYGLCECEDWPTQNGGTP